MQSTSQKKKREKVYNSLNTKRNFKMSIKLLEYSFYLYERILNKRLRKINMVLCLVEGRVMQCLF